MAYKFQTLHNSIQYTYAEQLFVDRLNSQTPHVWKRTLTSLVDFVNDSQVDDRRDNLKDNIKDQLKNFQGNFCIYCGSEFICEMLIHREHIVRKALYPQWTFEPLNLVLSCARCNLTYKSTKNFLNSIDTNDYSLCTFLIVHPYLDDINDHIDYCQAMLMPKNNSQKGQYTITVFNLNEDKLIRDRKQHLYYNSPIYQQLSEHLKELIKKIRARNYF